MQTPAQPFRPLPLSPINLPRPFALQHVKDFYHAKAATCAYYGDWTGECQALERVRELWYATVERDAGGAFHPLVRRKQAPNGQWLPEAEFDLGVSA